NRCAHSDTRPRALAHVPSTTRSRPHEWVGVCASGRAARGASRGERHSGRGDYAGAVPSLTVTRSLPVAKAPASTLDNVIALAKKRGFVFPSGEIYGGTRSAWDYGPLGVE